MKAEATKNLDLTTYKFPDVTNLDVIFPTFNTDKVLLDEAMLRGFDNHNNPYCKLFSQIFYSGGRVKFKEGIDPDFVKRAFGYFKALAGSWGPKHEHKEAVCAMILSEICEPELNAIKK